jgi:C4-dicarboxylate-binding protein DctP
MRYLAVFIVLFCSTVGASARCDFGESIIRLDIDAASPTDVRQRMSERLKSAINAEFQGRVCLEIVSDDDGLSGPQLIDALRSGSVEMVLPSFSSLGELAPKFQVFDLPFAFRDERALHRFVALADTVLDASLRDVELKSLAFWFGNFDQMTAKRSIYLPGDVAGLKFFTDGGTKAERLVSALDGVTQTRPEHERVDAIKDGRVEAQCVNWEQLRRDGSALLQQGVTQTNHFCHGYALVVSRSWWDDLEPGLQKSLEEFAISISKQINLETGQQQFGAKRAVIQSGTSVRALTRQQRQLWTDRVEPVWDAFDDKKLLDLLIQADRAL